MPERVERHDPEGVDYGWVMQTTFVATIVAGVPVVALLSLAVPPQETWAARAEFALRVGAVVWLVTNVAVYLYAARVAGPDDADERTDSGDPDDADERTDSGDPDDADERTDSGDPDDADERTDSGDPDDADERTDPGDADPSDPTEPAREGA